MFRIAKLHFVIKITLVIVAIAILLLLPQLSASAAPSGGHSGGGGSGGGGGWHGGGGGWHGGFSGAPAFSSPSGPSPERERSFSAPAFRSEGGPWEGGSHPVYYSHPAYYSHPTSESYHPFTQPYFTGNHPFINTRSMNIQPGTFGYRSGVNNFHANGITTAHGFVAPGSTFNRYNNVNGAWNHANYNGAWNHNHYNWGWNHYPYYNYNHFYNNYWWYGNLGYSLFYPFIFFSGYYFPFLYDYYYPYYFDGNLGFDDYLYNYYSNPYDYSDIGYTPVNEDNYYAPSPEYNTAPATTVTEQPVSNETWVAAQNGDVPTNAIVYGHSDNGNPTYYCRESYKHSTYYGELIPGEGCYATEGQSVTIRFIDYEVLVNPQ